MSGAAEVSIDPVDWALAERVATRVSGSDPFAQSYHFASLVDDFRRLTPHAEQLVTVETGLIPDGPATSRVVSRAEWIRANIRSFRRLLRPLTQRMGSQKENVFSPVARRLAGVEVGTMLGLLSQRVLGQYDLLVADDDDRFHQDVVSFVGPNILSLEKRYAFAPVEFRLWIALHEVTHRAQFTGVPWMRAHFLGLVDETLGSADPDPKRFLFALQRTVASVRAGRNPLMDGGIVALLADEKQRTALDAMGGLMSLLEGHGDITMDRAGMNEIACADRFSDVLRHRRNTGGKFATFVRQASGLETKLRQYEDGERFIESVEASRGKSFVDQVWIKPERLPSLEEIRSPDQWVARMEQSR